MMQSPIEREAATGNISTHLENGLTESVKV